MKKNLFFILAMVFCSFKTFVNFNVLVCFSIFSACLMFWQNSLVHQPSKTNQDIGRLFSKELDE